MKTYFRKDYVGGSVTLDSGTYNNSDIIFNEFVNGEGLHFIINCGKSDEQRFDLNSDQLEAIFAVAMYAGFADTDNVSLIMSQIKRGL